MENHSLEKPHPTDTPTLIPVPKFVLVGLWEEWCLTQTAETYQRLYRHLFPIVRRTVFAVLRREDQQIAHDAFTAGMLAMQPAETATYLQNRFKRIARNLARNEITRTKRFAKCFTSLPCEGSVEFDSRRLDLKMLLEKMTPDEQTLIRRWCEGRLETPEEKAEFKKLKGRLRTARCTLEKKD